MKLVRIDHSDVVADCENGRSSKFNTCFHSIDEIDLPRPSEEPYSFSRWLPLILKTRNLSEADAQTVQLSPSQARILLDASAVSIITGEKSRVFEEDIREEVYPAFSELQFPPEGLFMRLDACSPKDGRQTMPGRLSLHSIDDIILRVTTSERAANSITKTLKSSRRTLNLTFLLFNTRMASSREYRVYCSPRNGNVAAISQYCWHKPWLFARLPPDEMREMAENIYLGVKSLHGQIIANLKPGEEQDALLLKQGFSFDVFFDEKSGAFELVELNVFGARSGCGSCLFHWVKDLALLYGEEDEVVFRVCW